MFEKGRWADLLEECERLLEKPEGGPWLDLQRYALAAMRELGGDYSAPRSAVFRALAGLLADFPSLPKATLADKTPAADETTRSWVQADETLKKYAPAAAAPAGGAPSSNGTSEALRQANRLIEEGKPADALGLLQGAREDAPSPREEFLRRLDLAEACLKA